MMQAIEIQDHARPLMAAMGMGAIAEAAQKARRSQNCAARNEAADWRRIEAALRLMQGPLAS